MAPSGEIRIRRLGPDDRELARTTFTLMTDVFGETEASLSDEYLAVLLGRSDFWALAALGDGTVVGGLTAHTLMMTAFEGAEIFLYDIAVDPVHQRRGIGRQLVDTLRHMAGSAGIDTVFVPADDEDTHAIDFYRAMGGTAASVTCFEFGPPAGDSPR